MTSLSLATIVATDAAHVSHFSDLEWNVIALAKRDTLASLAAPSRLSRGVRRAFGFPVGGPLADPHLEALRRLAVLAWRRGFALPLAEINRFLSEGFSEAQIETLVASVTGLRVGRSNRKVSA